LDDPRSGTPNSPRRRSAVSLIRASSKFHRDAVLFRLFHSQADDRSEEGGFSDYNASAPIDDIQAIKGCAILIIDAEKEELFDIRQQGELAFNRAAEPKKRVVIPGITHYGIYTVAREQSIGLAIEWMDLYLKGGMQTPVDR
jgi:hypothetical protein